MRLMRTVVFALVALALVGASTASAQTPYIGLFFDAKGTRMDKNCPGVGVIDSVFFLAYNLPHSQVDGVEFRVLYPPEMIHIADQLFPGATGLYPPGSPKAGQPISIGVTLGSTPNGVSAVWGLPQNGFVSAIFIGLAIVQWNCGPGCVNFNIPIRVVGHPLFNATPRWTDRPTFSLHDAVGLTSLICATVPVEETTWGRVKALYAE